MAASQTLRAALTKVEAAHPGFTYDFVMGLVRRADLSVNMNESLLRLQGQVSDVDGNESRSLSQYIFPGIFCDHYASLSIQITDYKSKTSSMYLLTIQSTNYRYLCVSKNVRVGTVQIHVESGFDATGTTVVQRTVHCGKWMNVFTTWENRIGISLMPVTVT